MEEKKQENTTQGWNGVERELATEIIKGSKRVSNAKDYAIAVMGIVIVAVAIGMAWINYKNDEHWRDLISEYDFITQDGEGYNYYNSDIGGNVNNVTEGYEEKEP